MKILTKPKKKVQINVTSLIDVMFILLIFFMVTSTFLEQPGMKLELPEAKSASIEKIEKMVVYIDADQQVYFNDKPVALDRLKDQLSSALKRSQKSTLVLRADEHVPHGLVVHVMDIAKEVGVKRLVVATRPAAAGASR